MAPVERLQKIIARAGIASRRAAEQLMRERRVTVNGVVADKPGAQADPETDHIRVDGKLLRPTSAARTYLAAFKPREMLTTLEDPEGRPTVRNLLHAARIRSRVFPVGRLDWDADGLLLLTDDGDWAQRIAHPRHHLGKVYRVKVRGTPSEPELERLRRGIFIEAGVRTAPALVEIEKAGEPTSWVRVTLFEGRHNQIKRMFERIGHPVRRLRRVAIGPIGLGRMRVGEVRALTMEELALIARALRGERATRASGSRARPAGPVKASKATKPARKRVRDTEPAGAATPARRTPKRPPKRT